MKQHSFLAIACMLVLFFSACKDDKKETPTTTTEDDGTTFTDSRDNKKYKFVKIGDQYWMAEDLDYRGGNHHCYDDIAANCDTYSVLYDSLAANSACPSGWHLPTDAEFRTLEKSIGFSDADTATTGARGDGSSLKAGGSTGFNVAVYAGQRGSSGTYGNKDSWVFYWGTKTYYRRFSATENTIARNSGSNIAALSRAYCIRCIKN